MNKRITNLINTIERKSKETYKKFKMWNAFFNEILSIDPSNPNLHSLVFTQKIIIYCGIVESLINSDEGSKNKFKNVMNSLNEEEKLIFIHNVLISEKEQNNKIVEEAIDAYLNNSKEQLEEVFNNRLNYFYGFRSRLVHKGEWPGSALFEGDNRPLFFITLTSSKKGGEEKPIKILERAFDIAFQISIDELILRAINRYLGIVIENDDLKNILKKELINKGMATKNFQPFKKKFNI